MESPHRARVPRLFSPDEVASVLNVSRSLVYQLIDSGKLVPHRIGNGRGAIRVSEDDLANFLATCRREKDEGATKPPQMRQKLKHLEL
jgi:excisionase family DNA binding protein